MINNIFSFILFLLNKSFSNIPQYQQHWTTIFILSMNEKHSFNQCNNWYEQGQSKCIYIYILVIDLFANTEQWNNECIILRRRDGLHYCKSLVNLLRSIHSNIFPSFTLCGVWRTNKQIDRQTDRHHDPWTSISTKLLVHKPDTWDTLKLQHLAQSQMKDFPAVSVSLFTNYEPTKLCNGFDIFDKKGNGDTDRQHWHL
jgi:hypothetical protein